MTPLDVLRDLERRIDAEATNVRHAIRRVMAARSDAEKQDAVKALNSARLAWNMLTRDAQDTAAAMQEATMTNRRAHLRVVVSDGEAA